jgi:hypothetical protein
MAGNERFTQRARRALSIAHQETEIRHFDLIGPEYLLIGLIEVDGEAARILREMGIRLDRIRQLISRMIGEGYSNDPNRIELSSESQLVLENAVDEARRLGHKYIGTEHVLLGLIKFDNNAVEILKRDGITPDLIRQQAGKVLYEIGYIGKTDMQNFMMKSNDRLSRLLRVFLCHSSTDKAQVRNIFQNLQSIDYVDPWFDEEKLLPGQKWQAEIPKAVRTSDVILVCLSKNSVDKIGYVQKEIKIALDVADEQPEGSIFIIPVRLEECVVPERLQEWQWVNLYEPKGMEKLFSSFRERAKHLGIILD